MHTGSFFSTAASTSCLGASRFPLRKTLGVNARSSATRLDENSGMTTWSWVKYNPTTSVSQRIFRSTALGRRTLYNEGGIPSIGRTANGLPHAGSLSFPKSYTVSSCNPLLRPLRCSCVRGYPFSSFPLTASHRATSSSTSLPPGDGSLGSGDVGEASSHSRKLLSLSASSSSTESLLQSVLNRWLPQGIISGPLSGDARPVAAVRAKRRGSGRVAHEPPWDASFEVALPDSIAHVSSGSWQEGSKDGEPYVPLLHRSSFWSHAQAASDRFTPSSPPTPVMTLPSCITETDKTKKPLVTEAASASLRVEELSPEPSRSPRSTKSSGSITDLRRILKIPQAPLSRPVEDPLEWLLRDDDEVGKGLLLEKSDIPPPAPFLILNIFTRRVVLSTSSTLQRLLIIGIDVDFKTRRLYVKDEEALKQFAQHLQEKTVSWPSQWTSSNFRSFRKRLEMTPVIDQVPAVVSEWLAVMYDMSEVRERHAADFSVAGTAVAGAALDTSGGLPGEAAASLYEESMTATKERLLSEADLTEEQQNVLKLALDGHNLYIGGSAGTGKSVLLRVLRRRLMEEKLTVSMTATTGLAAFHIGGTTLHHRFGITIDGRFLRKKELKSYDVIVIDEVSMLSKSVFEDLEAQLRRAHGNELPFGGVQMILCGDFLQLGAISAQSIVCSPVFRQHFVMLKLLRSLRQQENPVFFLHLQALRHGKMLPTWTKTVQCIDTYQHFVASAQSGSVVEGNADEENGAASPNPSSLPSGEAVKTGKVAEESPQGLPSLPKGAIVLPPLSEDAVEGISDDSLGMEYSLSADMHPAIIVENAVNLLPTNALVRQANEVMLSKLEGESVQFQSMVTTPFLQDTWSPSYLLAVGNSPWEKEGTGEPFPLVAVDTAALQSELEKFLLSCLPRRSNHVQEDADIDHEDIRLHPDRYLCLYQLYEDGYVFRVRVPAAYDTCKPEQNPFLKKIHSRLQHFLNEAKLGVRLRDILPTSEGLHTDSDQFLLQEYSARSHMAAPFTCKLGAKVMLRANLTGKLVNGSLGTIVGFVEMKPEHLPAAFKNSSTRAEKEGFLMQYSDFLRYEHNFHTPVMPLVDFGNGDPIPIPPVHFPCGGFANTHYYTGGIVTIPLTLAYAFTVHKVQGLTLVGRVHLELSKMWPCEHLLYVAMSRVRNPEQLSISNFHLDLIRVASDCLLFDRSVPPVEMVKVPSSLIPATWIRDPSKRKRAQKRRARRRRVNDDSLGVRSRSLRQNIKKLQEQFLLRLEQEKSSATMQNYR